MAKSFLKNKKALSPVIATVILVAVTIVVAVSVAYWMGTIAGSYTTFEQIEMPTSYAEYVTDLFGTGINGWKVHIELKNTGSADATIENIFLNAKPLKDYPDGSIKLFKTDDSAANEISLDSISIHINKGEKEKVIIWIKDGIGQGCTSGTRIDLKLHSAAGRDYPLQVKLP